MEISYDPGKCQRNIEARGLSFELVRELEWSSALVVEDLRRDYGERRFQVLGYIGERLHALVFTPRDGAVHVISLRKANSREVKRYEQATRS
ncbi:Ribonuclease toxin, BrnT, of type II toxin-antitoxin system [compost metagenome]